MYKTKEYKGKMIPRIMGTKGSWVFRISDLGKTLMELICNPVVNFDEVRRAQLAISTLLTSTSVLLGSFQIF